MKAAQIGGILVIGLLFAGAYALAETFPAGTAQSAQSTSYNAGTPVNQNDPNISYFAGSVGIGDPDPTSPLSVYGDSLILKQAPLIVERAYNDIASNQPFAVILKNEGELDGGKDYQNETHLALQAGVEENHRRYINWLDHEGNFDWRMGSNAGQTFILFDNVDGIHRLTMRNATHFGGETWIGSAGEGAFKINYHPANFQGTGGVEIWSGGAAEENTKAFEFAPSIDSFRAYNDSGNVTFNLETDTGFLGLGEKTNPSYFIDVESRSLNNLMRWSVPTQTFDARARSWVYETLVTGNDSQFLIIDKDNSNSRAVLELKGNAGKKDVLYAASAGYIGIGTSAPEGTLHVTSPNKNVIIWDTSSTVAGACIKIKDRDGKGYTYMTTLDGEVEFSTNSCE
ncbi:MAG: hypothetical protein ACJKSS_01165 [Patescibacteria group bacterium UBA2103]